MRLSNFRLSGTFAIAALVAGSVALPTLAKEPTKFQTVKPVLVAENENAIVESESINAEDFNAAAENAPGAAIRDNVRSFLQTASPNQTLNLSLPVEDFIYVNGGIGEPSGSTNRNLFQSFFKSEFGIVGGANNTVLKGPLFATATSAFSPNLTQTDIDKIKSVTVKFDYAFKSEPKDTLQLIVRNVTTRENTFETKLASTPGKSVTENITKAFTKPGQYVVKYRLVKLGTTDNDAAGFDNVTLTIVRN